MALAKGLWWGWWVGGLMSLSVHLIWLCAGCRQWVPCLQRCHAMSLLATHGGSNGEDEFKGGSYSLLIWPVSPPRASPFLIGHSKIWVGLAHGLFSLHRLLGEESRCAEHRYPHPDPLLPKQVPEGNLQVGNSRNQAGPRNHPEEDKEPVLQGGSYGCLFQCYSVLRTSKVTHVCAEKTYCLGSRFLSLGTEVSESMGYGWGDRCTWMCLLLSVWQSCQGTSAFVNSVMCLYWFVCVCVLIAVCVHGCV